MAKYILYENHCPVKKFHCRNGAKVGPLRHLADESPLRLKQSYGNNFSFFCFFIDKVCLYWDSYAPWATK